MTGVQTCALPIYPISVKGNTLQINNDVTTSWGFAVASNAKIILVQDAEIYRNGVKTGDKDLMADITPYDNGVKGLEKMVKDLNDQFQGYLSAVFEGGVATSVVVYDTKESDIEIGGGASKAEGIINVDTTNPAAVIVEYVSDTHTAPGLDACIDAIVAKLQALGHTVTRITESSGVYSFETTSGRYPMTFKWATSGKQEQVYLNVDGESVAYDVTATTGDAIATALNITGTKKGAYVKVNGVAQLTSAAITPAKDMKLEYGFYQVTLTTTDLANAGSNKGGSTVTAPADMTAATGTAVKYVKNGALNLDVVLTIKTGEKTLGVVNVSTNAGTITAGGSIPTNTDVGAKHTVTVALTAAQVQANPTITLSLADRTDLSVTVGGVTKTFAAGSKITDALTEFGITYGTEGTYAKKTVGGTSNYVAVSSSTPLVDNATYEFGYYKVTAANSVHISDTVNAAGAIIGSTTAKFSTVVAIDAASKGEYVVADTAWYVKKDASLAVTVTNVDAGATATALGSVAITVTNATADKTATSPATDANKVTLADGDAAGAKTLTVNITSFTDDAVITFTGTAT